MQHTQTRFLSLPQVLALTSESRAGWYCKVKEGIAPKQIALGRRRVVWLSDEVELYMQSLIKAARG